MVDTLIRLFESTSMEFTSNGMGSLPDAVSCFVTEEKNGEFELEMEYPITGKRYSELVLRRILVAKPNPYDDVQPFRIYNISRPINGIVTINAEHISYDMSGYPVSAFTAGTPGDAITKLKANCAVDCPFIFSTDIMKNATLEIKTPSSMRYILGGSEESILATYGGEFIFDKYDVKLRNSRGYDRGVSIRYGKNLVDIKQEENCSEVYTGIYPYWYSEQDGLLELPEKIVNVQGTYNYVRILPVDCSQIIESEGMPTVDILRQAAIAYIAANAIGIPKVSITVSFAMLSQSEEYRNVALLEEVHLCDTVNVVFEKLNVNATAQCIKTVYNVLTGKYDSVDLGEAKNTLATTITSQFDAIKEAPSKNYMDRAIDHATKLITGGLGGYVVLHQSAETNHPDEILIMDTDDILTATNVWRWNKNGLGFSGTGYNGPYETAITKDGKIVANFITVGELEGSLIKAGTVSADALSVEYKSDLTSKFEVMDGKIAAEVTRAEGVEDDLRSAITVTDGKITTEVESAKQEMSSLIETEIGKITLSVTNYGTTSSLVLSKDGIALTSDNVIMSGVVTFQSLQDPADVTTINGGSLTSCNIYAMQGDSTTFSQMTYLGYAVYIGNAQKAMLGINTGYVDSSGGYAPALILGADTPAYVEKYWMSGLGHCMWIGNGTQSCGILFNFTNNTYTFVGTQV